jgi:hypothetical protein
VADNSTTRKRIASLQRRAKRLGNDLQALHDEHSEMCTELETWVAKMQDLLTLLMNLDEIIAQAED